jgi:L-lactate dehydrogenase
VSAAANAVGIIGTGWVGSSVAISTLHTGGVDELLLNDLHAEIAEGEAMDLAHGSSFYPSAHVRSVPLEAMMDTAALVIAAGRGGKPGQTRLDLLRDNATLGRDLGKRLHGYPGIVIVVTNPVDVLTFVVQQASGLPPERVIGTGTMLDTARLRQVLGRELRIEPRSIHAQVVGEHGDSEVVLWSGAQVGGVPLRAWPGWTREREAAVALEVRRAAYEIIQRKGATNHAIGLVTAALLKWLLRDERRVLTVSRALPRDHPLGAVALSLPCVAGRGGALETLAPAMDEVERAALERSAGVLRNAIASIEG